MSFSVPMGFGLAGLVVFFAAFHDVKNPAVFLNQHAAIIVFGGSVAAALICFPGSYFIKMFGVVFDTVTGRRRAQTRKMIDEIVKVAEGLQQKKPIREMKGGLTHPFLRESFELMDSGGLSEAELMEVIEKRVELQNEKYRRNALAFKVLGKFPPAFGLVGTSLGMITLLQGLGEKDAFERLGPSMSVALVATFYGLLLANLVFIPLGENLNAASDEDLLMRRIVSDGIRLLLEQKHPILVREYLQSYLAPGERQKIAPLAATA